MKISIRCKDWMKIRNWMKRRKNCFTLFGKQLKYLAYVCDTPRTKLSPEGINILINSKDWMKFVWKIVYTSGLCL